MFYKPVVTGAGEQEKIIPDFLYLSLQHELQAFNSQHHTTYVALLDQ